MAARLSALCAGRFLLPGRFLVLIFLRGLVEPRTIVRLEGVRKLKSPPHLGLETATFRLVAYCLNQVRYRVPPELRSIVYLIFNRRLIKTARTALIKSATFFGQLCGLCLLPRDFQIKYRQVNIKSNGVTKKFRR
jgi:hypothetical protein